MEIQNQIELLESRLHDLEAKEGIRDTVGRYAKAVDYGHFAELDLIFTDDIVFSIGQWREEQMGKKHALQFIRDYLATYQHPHRYIANECIHIDGEKGSYSSYFFVVQSYKGQSYIGWGIYDWLFRLEDGIWKIAKMVIDIKTMTTLEKGWGMEQDRVVPFPPR